MLPTVTDNDNRFFLNRLFDDYISNKNTDAMIRWEKNQPFHWIAR